MDQTAFSTAEMSLKFGEFGQWLIGMTGPKKAALRIHRYLLFFMEMERQWKHIPSYSKLLEHFGAEGLRRVRLPMRWLREALAVEPDSVAREENSERRRIAVILGSIHQATPAGQALAIYGASVMERVKEGKSSLRSVRLALRPAASLLLTKDLAGSRLPDQAALDCYLCEAPGQMSAITGFINFLNKTYNLGLVNRVDEKKVRKVRHRIVEKEIMEMAKNPEEGEDFKKRWITAGLEYFHGINASKKKINSASITEDAEGFQVDLDGIIYSMPKCVHRD
ncbi:hypothetical protein [Desulfonatronum parangueonense]